MYSFLKHMVDRLKLLKEVFDDKTVRVLEELTKIQDIFYLRDLSKETGVSLATTYRIIKKLVDIGIVKKEKVGKFVQYKVKKGEKFNEINSMLLGEEIDPLKIFKKEIEKKHNSSFQLYNTKDGKTFLISKSIDDVKESKKKTKERTGEELNILTVTPDQFENMKDMGIIKSGEYL